MNFWYTNSWDNIKYGIEIQLFTIWIDFWAVEITILNFTFGLRILNKS